MRAKVTAAATTMILETISHIKKEERSVVAAAEKEE